MNQTAALITGNHADAKLGRAWHAMFEIESPENRRAFVAELTAAEVMVTHDKTSPVVECVFRPEKCELVGKTADHRGAVYLNPARAPGAGS